MGRSASAYVAILETMGGQGTALKYHACTPDDSAHMLGKVLPRDTPNVTYGALDQNRTVLVAPVSDNAAVHHFDADRGHRDGSLVICPLRFSRHKTFGTLGIDTLRADAPKDG